MRENGSVDEYSLLRRCGQWSNEAIVEKNRGRVINAGAAEGKEEKRIERERERRREKLLPWISSTS